MSEARPASPRPARGERRRQILEVLARELESTPGSRITTAALARALDVSEAALYRHFPSKARMFEGLIEFAEQSLFGLVGRILEQERDAAGRCEQLLALLLGFAERNPGITRILVGDALVGEHERLRTRVAQVFERLESQWKQVLRESALGPGRRPRHSVAASAALLRAAAEGAMLRYVRSGFRDPPTRHLPEQWEALREGLFKPDA